MNVEQRTRTEAWPFPGQIIRARVPGAKWHANCEFCAWNWFSPTFGDLCDKLKRHLLEQHQVDIDQPEH